MNVQFGQYNQPSNFQAPQGQQRQVQFQSRQQQAPQAKPQAVKFGFIDGGIISGPLACCAAPIACCFAPFALLATGAAAFFGIKGAKALVGKLANGVKGAGQKLPFVNKAGKAEKAAE